MFHLNSLSVNPTKWSNTLKQFVGKLALKGLIIHLLILGLKFVQSYQIIVTISNQLNTSIIVSWMIDNKERKLKAHEHSSINSHQILLYGNQTQDKIKFFGKTRDGVAIELNNQAEVTLSIKQPIKHLFLYATEGNRLLIFYYLAICYYC